MTLTLILSLRERKAADASTKVIPRTPVEVETAYLFHPDVSFSISPFGQRKTADAFTKVIPRTPIEVETVYLLHPDVNFQSPLPEGED